MGTGVFGKPGAEGEAIFLDEGMSVGETLSARLLEFFSDLRVTRKYPLLGSCILLKLA